MIITKNNKFYKEIIAIEDLEKYYICLFANRKFKKFGDNIRENIIKIISNTSTISIKNFHEQFLKKIFKEKNCIKKEFWIERGFTAEEFQPIISEIQSRRGKKSAEKYENLKKENYLEWSNDCICHPNKEEQKNNG